MSRGRRQYWDSLSSALEVERLGERVDWIRLRDSVFCILYGLPLHVAVEIGVRAARRYLPLFRVRHPQVEYVEGTLFSIEQSASGSGLRPGRPDGVPFDKRALGSVSFQFLQAVDHLLLAAGPGEKRPGLVAALVEWSIYCCVLQRRHDVWTADDPAAAAAAIEWQKLDELLMTRSVRPEAHEYRAMLAALEEFLVGRSVDENIAAIAVEWREWRIIADWLREVVNSYPEVVDGEALDTDFDRWERSGGSWEAMAD